MRIVATMLDGTKHETETSLFQCLADRFAFREHFGVSYLSLAKRFSGPEAATDPEWDERWLAYFDWRCLARNGYRESFNTFIATVAEIDHPDIDVPVEGELQEEEPDPTTAPGEPTSTATISSLPTSSEPSA